MPGDVSPLNPARRAAPPAQAGGDAAARYLQCADEALALLPGLVASDDREAVCRIAETWLTLAEAELARPRPPAP